MDSKKAENNSMLGDVLNSRIKRFVVNHPEAGFATIRDFVRKTVEKELQALGAD